MRITAGNLLFVALVAVLPHRAAAQELSDYDSLARIVSEPVFDGRTVDKALDAYSDGRIMSRKEFHRQLLGSLGKLNYAHQVAREKIAEPLWNCYSTYLEIRRLDSRTPDYEGAAKATLEAAPALLKKRKDWNDDDKNAIGGLVAKGLFEIGGAIVNSYRLSSERDKYRGHYQTSRSTNCRVMSGLAARRYAASTFTAKASGGGEILDISINPSFANTYCDDCIVLRNNSGKDLTACTLVVKLSGLYAKTNAAEGDSHFHFIDKWPAGATRYLWYPSRGFSGIATNQSVDVMQKIEVLVSSDQLTSTSSLDLASGLYDKLLKEWADKHLAPSSFSGRWYTDKDNWFDPAGFEVKYNGDMRSFKFKMVIVEASAGLRSVRIHTRDDDTVWSQGEKKWICHKDFNSINPSKVKVIIWFPGSSYEHVVTWNR